MITRERMIEIVNEECWKWRRDERAHTFLSLAERIADHLMEEMGEDKHVKHHECNGCVGLSDYKQCEHCTGFSMWKAREDKPKLMMKYTCHPECAEMPPHEESYSCAQFGCVPVEDNPWKCKHCGTTETWFDRSLDEHGNMTTRCRGCGRDVDKDNPSENEIEVDGKRYVAVDYLVNQASCTQCAFYAIANCSGLYPCYSDERKDKRSVLWKLKEDKPTCPKCGGYGMKKEPPYEFGNCDCMKDCKTGEIVELKSEDISQGLPEGFARTLSPVELKINELVRAVNRINKGGEGDSQI